MDKYKYLVVARCFTFNQAPYIVDTMNGFALQETTFPVYTLIVDDASTDNEPEVIRNYLAEHFQAPYREEETDDYYLICANHKTNTNCYFVVLLLKYNHYSIKKNKFPYLSEWLDNAKYQAMCEGDDYWTDPQKLQKQIEELESDSTLGMCYTRCRYFYQDRGQLASKPWGGDSRTFNDFMKSNTVPTLTVIFKQELFRRYNDEIASKKKWLLGDYPMWIFFSHESGVSFLPIETGVYRVLAKSASHTQQSDDKIKFSMSHIDVLEYFNKKYNYKYTHYDFEGMRWRSELRSYAIYNECGNYIICWLKGVICRPSLLLKKSSYKYFTFFFIPQLRNERK